MPHGADQRYPHLGRGQRPVAAEQHDRTGVGGIVEADRVPGDDGDVTEAGPDELRQPRAEPALLHHLLDRHDPRPVGVGRPRRVQQGSLRAPGGRAANGNGPRRTAGGCRTASALSAEDLGHLHLAVVGGHQQHGVGRESGANVADQPVGGGHLGVVVLPQAVLVGDLVDAVVVGEDERLAGRPRAGGPPPARFEGSRQPTWRTPARWACVNPLLANSVLATTGTEEPRNGRRGWTSLGTRRRRASPPPVLQRSTFRTSPYMAIR